MGSALQKLDEKLHCLCGGGPVRLLMCWSHIRYPGCAWAGPVPCSWWPNAENILKCRSGFELERHFAQCLQKGKTSIWAFAWNWSNCGSEAQLRKKLSNQQGHKACRIVTTSEHSDARVLNSMLSVELRKHNLCSPELRACHAWPLRSPTNIGSKKYFSSVSKVKIMRFKMAFKMEEGAGEGRKASASPTPPLIRCSLVFPALSSPNWLLTQLPNQDGWPVCLFGYKENVYRVRKSNMEIDKNQRS